MRVMGKVTGFLEFERDDRDYVAGRRSARAIGASSCCRCRRRITRTQAARCMDCGVPVLPGHRRCVPARRAARSTTRSRTGTTSSITAIGKRPRATCTRPTIFRKSPAASARRRAKPPARSTSTRTRSPSRSIECAIADRAIAQRAASPEPRRSEDRQEGRRHRLRTGGPGLRPAARARRARRACLREVGQGRRPDALRHPRLQDGEASLDRRVAQMEAEGVRSTTAPMSASMSMPTSSSATTTPSCSTGGAEKARDLPVPGPRAQGHSFRHGFPAAAEPPRVAAKQPATPSRSSPTASTSW